MEAVAAQVLAEAGEGDQVVGVRICDSLLLLVVIVVVLG